MRGRRDTVELSPHRRPATPVDVALGLGGHDPGVAEYSAALSPQPLEAYAATIGDTAKVINMLVGDTQRITAYAERGFAAPQHVPGAVLAAYRRLVSAGFTSRLL